MSKQFSIKMSHDAREVVAKFKSAAEKNDVRFNGDEHKGQFSGKGIEGHYAISGDVLTITIEKKPMLIGWSLIEAKVRDFLV
ncbi:MAG: hypothetical protein ACKN9T_10745 [Candidatus Methylumidiphilus sp.]